jgi:ABC-2 type transport system permease protein
MSVQADTAPPAPAASRPTRPLYWSVRRELWEHRYLYLAPLALAAFLVLAFFFTALLTPAGIRAAILANPKKAHEFMEVYGGASFAILLSGFVVSIIHSLSALHGERRDRSILFWKSLPVSDADTVVAKALVAIVLTPAMVFAVIVAANLAMLGLQSLAWLLTGFDPRALWARLELPFMWLVILSGLPFMALWYAPLYAWMLLVSAWARRVPVVWAAAPLVAGLILERMILPGSRTPLLLERRLIGAIREPMTVNGDGKTWIARVSDLDPLRIYTLPELWIGVALALLFLVLAVRVRRSRGPI